MAGTPLIDWRTRAELSQHALAERLGCSQATVSQLERGQRAPSGRLAAEIERLTGGAIPAASWWASAAGPSNNRINADANNATA